jgi:hypothetical protein
MRTTGIKSEIWLKVNDNKYLFVNAMW